MEIVTEINTEDLRNILAGGSTAQKQFIEGVDNVAFEKIIKTLQDMEYNLINLRGDINGGIIRTTDESAGEDYSDILSYEIEDGLYLEIL